MKYLISLAFLISGCGGKVIFPEDCEEVAGIYVCTEVPISADDIVNTVLITERQVKKVYPLVENTIRAYKDREVVASFIKSKLAYDCKQGPGGLYFCEDHLNGLVHDAKYIYVSYYGECYTYQIFAHELLHVISRLYLKRADSEHTGHRMFNEWFYNDMENNIISDVIEWQINAEIRNTLPGC